MKIIASPLEMQKIATGLRSNSTMGFVPTMGALHAGHRSLVWKAKSENDVCIASIFVNPTQFNDPNDFKNYPKTQERDQEMLVAEKVDILFQPTFATLYPDNFNFSVSEKELSQKLCGKSRPGHFLGVLTVVMKLLNIVLPTKAYFGEKDYQQLELIRQMAAAFFIPTEVVSCPIVRDEFGLALSSRNSRLSSEGLDRARIFASELRKAKGRDDFYAAMTSMGIKVDYLEDLNERRYAAVVIENVRLIDNVPL